MKFKIYQDQEGLFRWTLKAANGNIIADSGEGYSTRKNAGRAAARMNKIIERGLEIPIVHAH